MHKSAVTRNKKTVRPELDPPVKPGEGQTPLASNHPFVQHKPKLNSSGKSE
jgi:hypothetical protein